MRGEVIKGHLDLLLLSIVGCGPLHGYAIGEELRRRSREAFDLPEGTVYPALHRLERSGLISSKWDTSSGRKRRVYQLTSSGKKSLAAQRKEWRDFSTAIGAVIGTAR